MLTLDTSALIVLIDRKAKEHEPVKAALLADAGPYLVPVGILAEVAYFLEQRFGVSALDLFLADLETGTFTLEAVDKDLPRIRELVRRYADLPLGFADASVIACAERNGGLTLSLDERHFGVVAREGRITVLPE